MNNWHIDYMAEYHRKDLLDEANHVRLVNLALQSRVYRPDLFTRIMHSFAGWMVSTGEGLHERYEIPSAHCHHNPSSSFAR